MDILKAADEGRFSLLILLDFFSAFDLVNHNISINKLCSKFGFKSLVLKWYKSYLNNRYSPLTKVPFCFDYIKFDQNLYKRFNLRKKIRYLEYF